MILNRVLSFAYICFYYYFTPLLVLIILTIQEIKDLNKTHTVPELGITKWTFKIKQLIRVISKQILYHL